MQQMHSKDKKLCTVFYWFVLGTGQNELFFVCGKWGQVSNSTKAENGDRSWFLLSYIYYYDTMILSFLNKKFFIWLRFPLIYFIHYVNIKVMLLFCLNFIWFIYTLKIMWYCRVTRKIIKSIRTYIVYRNLCIII